MLRRPPSGQRLIAHVVGCDRDDRDRRRMRLLREGIHDGQARHVLTWFEPGPVADRVAVTVHRAASPTGMVEPVRIRPRGHVPRLHRTGSHGRGDPHVPGAACSRPAPDPGVHPRRDGGLTAVADGGRDRKVRPGAPSPTRTTHRRHPSAPLGRAVGGGSSPAGRRTPGNAVAVIPVRDSKRPAGPAIAFSPHAWRAFIAPMG